MNMLMEEVDMRSGDGDGRRWYPPLRFADAGEHMSRVAPGTAPLAVGEILWLCLVALAGLAATLLPEGWKGMGEPNGRPIPGELNTLRFV